MGINFGSFEITWNERDLLSTKITIQLRDKRGKEVLTKVIYLRDLQIKKAKINGENWDDCVVHTSRWKRLINHIIFNRLLKGDTFFIFILLLPFIVYHLLKALFHEFKECLDLCCKRESRVKIQKKKKKKKEDKKE